MFIYYVNDTKTQLAISYGSIGCLKTSMAFLLWQFKHQFKKPILEENISNWHMDKISSVGEETTGLFYQALLLKLFGAF